jgi:hypothetical protein
MVIAAGPRIVTSSMGPIPFAEADSGRVSISVTFDRPVDPATVKPGRRRSTKAYIDGAGLAVGSPKFDKSKRRSSPANDSKPALRPNPSRKGQPMTAPTSRVRLSVKKSARRRGSPVRTVRFELQPLEARQMLAVTPLVAPEQISNAAFVSDLYTNVLFRQPDAAGLAHYTDLLNQGELSRGQVFSAFVASPAYQSSVAPTVNLYLTLLGTRPDMRTAAADEAQLASGVLDPVELAGQILDSPAFAARHAELAKGDESAFAAGLYRLAFNRAPDSGGIAVAAAQLAQGASRAAVAADLVTSPQYEGQVVHRYQDLVDAAYNAFLDGTPDARDYAKQVRAMRGGRTADGLVSVLLNSQQSQVAGAYRPTAPLGTETQVTAPVPHFQGDPGVAAFANGSYVVVWHVVLEPGEQVPGDSTTAGIFAQRYDKSGNPVGSPITVSQSNPNVTLFDAPEVATNGTNRFIVTWAEQVPKGSDIRSRLFNANGSPRGNQSLVSGPIANLVDEPRVAMSRKGGYAIVWRGPSRDPHVPAIFAQLHQASGKLVRRTFRVNQTSQGASWPSVGMDGAGNFVVSWEAKNAAKPGSVSNVFARRFNSAGSPQGAAWRVRPPAPGIQGDSAVALSPDRRRILVTWVRSNGRGYDILARSYTSRGKGAGRAFRVNATEGQELDPALSFDRNHEDFVVVWNDQGTGGASTILAQRYNLKDVPQGSELVVSTNSTRSKSAPAVATDGSGNLVVAWSSTDEGGSADNVFTQREAVAATYALRSITLDPAPPPATNDFPMLKLPGFGSTSDPPGGVRFAIIGDYGWSDAGWSSISDLQPVDYVGRLIRSWKPDFTIGLVDTNYVTGRYDWYDQNVGKYYAPYLYPYDYECAYATWNDYAHARADTPPATYNRFFNLPGNHDEGILKYSDSPYLGVVGSSRRSFDRFFGKSIRQSPTVSPLAGTYYNQAPYNSKGYGVDYGSDQYYDYLLHPINASGQVVANLANFYMVDANLSGETKSSGGYLSGPNSPQAQSILATAKSDPNGAPWQFFASHYEPYTSSSDLAGTGGIVNMRWNFAGSNVQVVLAGHEHNYERVQPGDGVTYMVNGVGGFDPHGISRKVGGENPFTPFASTPVAGSVTRQLGWGATLVTMTPKQVTFQTYMGGNQDNDLAPINFQLVDQFTLTR